MTLFDFSVFWVLRDFWETFERLLRDFWETIETFRVITSNAAITTTITVIPITAMTTDYRILDGWLTVSEWPGQHSQFPRFFFQITTSLRHVTPQYFFVIIIEFTCCIRTPHLFHGRKRKSTLRLFPVSGSTSTCVLLWWSELTLQYNHWKWKAGWDVWSLIYIFIASWCYINYYKNGHYTAHRQ